MLKMINFLYWLYLFLTLIEAVTGEAVRTEFGCENETLLLHCPLLSEISIVRANYGRFSLSVCNFRALDNIHTNCDSSHTTTDILKHRCNRLSLCQIEIHSGVFPTSCPDTPKYLEVQYHCQPPGQEEAGADNDRMPQISDNMTSVWSSREAGLDSQRVQQVLDTAILSVSQAGGEEEADKNVTITSGAGLRQLPSDNEPQLTTNTNVSYFYNSSSLTNNNYLPLNNLPADTQDVREPVLTRREILIITLTSIVAVILIVIAAVVVIWKR